MLALALLLACAPKPEEGDTADSAADTAGGGGDTDTAADTDTGGADTDVPVDPSPLTLQVAGSVRETLVFDAPTCTIQGANFRMFWRNAGGEHVFVLVAEVLGLYMGPSSYDSGDGTVRVKLQEEAGGEKRYFGTDTTAGDTAEIVVEGQTGTHAWGEFTFDTLTGPTGAVTATPQPVPIWCAGTF